MTWLIFFTGLSTLLMLASAFAAWLALKQAAAIDVTAHQLVAGLRDIDDVKLKLTALDGRLQRVAGRVYVQARRPAATHDTDDDSLSGDDDSELAAMLRLQAQGPKLG